MYTTRPRTYRPIVALFFGALFLTGCGGDSGSAPGSSEAPQPRPDGASVNASSPDARDADDRAVISENMPYAEVGDHLVYGYFVAPSDMFEPLPAVIMIHDWWGLNDSIRAAADRLASRGYIVLAIDLFEGETATTPAAARELMLTVVEDPESANQNILSAYEFVSETAGAPAVAALGWRFGGTWALNSAVLLPGDLDASILYYAAVTSDEDKLRPINTPILGLFAAKDISIKTESVAAFESALQRLRKDYEIRIYDDVRQGFADEGADNFDAAAANDAWNRTLDFLQRHLAGKPLDADLS
ncbi:MAG: dienelactone hydrolase family protein [Gammaproteobacteria bacterium]|nr:dienelactone hydrolase family protein [Gammaproteobacteria bacterium]